MIAYPRFRSSLVSPRRLGKPCVDSQNFGDSDLTLPTVTCSSSEDTSFSHYLDKMVAISWKKAKRALPTQDTESHLLEPEYPVDLNRLCKHHLDRAV
jgi:hypothetical protein